MTPIKPQGNNHSSALDAHIALLRGINVGGNNKLLMADLAAMFAGAGCAEVRTYIQSGNVVFRAPASLAASLPDHISKLIAERFGITVPVVIRTSGELAVITQSNPFIEAGVGPDALHVMFLADLPNSDRVDSLDATRSPPDTFIVRGREVFLNCPEGLARTKLTNAYFDKQLATVSTVRNWRTVLKLLELVNY